MNRRYSSCLVVILLGVLSNAYSQKNIKGLINAEKQFAWFTASHTVKEGFMNYMDSAGIIFKNGAGVNALDNYRKQNAGPGILNWEPAFAVISASGDMGATTGPMSSAQKQYRIRLWAAVHSSRYGISTPRVSGRTWRISAALTKCRRRWFRK
jgi:hypothetical protein